jgi:thiamine biosynthesis lipoprotein
MPCCPRPDGWVARAQVWLGTLVEVALPATDASDSCFTAAFAQIAHAHRTMSAHDASSDLARIARDAHHATVPVDAGTYAVLRLAQQLFRESGGTFDVAIPPLPSPDEPLPASAAGCMHDSGAPCGGMDALHLEPGLGVRATAPLALDLGGIAKGYAVDRAVDAMRATGARAGLVNAGGDLRVFGTDNWMAVRVRHPEAPAHALQLFEVRNAAVATSADYFRDDARGLVDPRTRSLRPFSGSVTVVAPTCALADALTKIVALQPAESAALLARHGAHAFTIGGEGPRSGPHRATTCATTCAATTANLRLPLAAVA